jgi:two-component system response regulator GlrR
MPVTTGKVVLLDGGGRLERRAPPAPSRLAGYSVERVCWPSADLAPSLPDGVSAVILALEEEARDVAGTAIAWLEARRTQVPVLALVPADLSTELGGRVARAADDFAVGPARWPEIDLRLRRLVAGAGDPVRVVARRLACDLGMRNLVGRDVGFQKLLRDLPRIAASDATVLITGETGTGKELHARAIHQLGPRHDRPFVAVDCGAFPESLLESELFGHAAGAFTDARVEHKGLARMAEGGTLFLDEVDALSLPAQGKLLRFLQERTFKPLGDERHRQADVRVLAATNRDLGALVAQQRFRADLYFRLGVLLVHLMPLRERAGDIPILVAHFLERCAAATGRTLRLTPAAVEHLVGHDYPGNVRELSNLIQRAAVMVEGEEIDVGDLEIKRPPATSSEATARASAPPSASLGPVRRGDTFREAKARAVEEFERAFVAELLRKHAGNITRASREARKDRRAFGRLVKKLGLDRTPG